MPRSFDGRAGGYLIRTFSSGRPVYFVSLYLEPGEGAGHCLLYSNCDVVESPDVMDDDKPRATITDDEKQKAKGLDIKSCAISLQSRHPTTRSKLRGTACEDALGIMAGVPCFLDI